MRFVAIAAGLAAALAPATTRAEGEAAAFFQNKQIQFFTMGSPGGGYDAYTRAIAARLEKSLGAHVVTINEPAAGGLVARYGFWPKKSGAKTAPQFIGRKRPGRAKT